jgi:CspA family cold shock protein
MTGTLNTGTVKFYNDQKGFGFVKPDDGDTDVFVHATALERAGMRGLVGGQKVAFDTQEDRRTGKIAGGVTATMTAPCGAKAGNRPNGRFFLLPGVVTALRAQSLRIKSIAALISW